MGHIIELLKTWKNQKLLKLFLILMILGSFIKFILELDPEVKDKLIEILVQEWFSLTYILIVIGLIISLLKHSHKISNDRIDDYLDSEETFSAEVQDLVKVTININKRNGFKVVLKNLNNQEIKKIKGTIYIYMDKERIKTIPFTIKNIKIGYKEPLFTQKKNSNNYKLFRYDDFEVHFHEIKLGNLYKTNLHVSGPIFHRTNYMLLNLDKFEDYKLLGLRIPYNLVWLKEKYSLLKNKVIFLYKQKIFGNQKWIKKFISFILRRLIFIIISLLLLVIIVTNGFFFIKAIISIWDILSVLFKAKYN